MDSSCHLITQCLSNRQCISAVLWENDIIFSDQLHFLQLLSDGCQEMILLPDEFVAELDKARREVRSVQD